MSRGVWRVACDVVVVNSVNVSVIDSRVAVFRRRSQCQSVKFPSRSFCSFIDAVSVIFSVINSRLAAFSSPSSSTASMSARSIPVSQLLQRVVVVNSVIVSVVNSLLAAVRRRSQCQSVKFPSRSFCSFIDAVSVIVSVINSRLAAFSSLSSSTASMTA